MVGETNFSVSYDILMFVIVPMSLLGAAIILLSLFEQVHNIRLCMGDAANTDMFRVWADPGNAVPQKAHCKPCCTSFFFPRSVFCFALLLPVHRTRLNRTPW